MRRHEELKRSFDKPPASYGPVPFWWWHGEPLTRERIGWQLEQLQAQGVAGVNVNYQHDSNMKTIPGEPPLFSEEWWELWQWTVEECSRRGMAIGFDDYTLAWPDKGEIALKLTQGNPELVGARLEAISAVAQPGETVTIPAPEKKSRTVMAAAYPVEEGELDAACVWMPPAADITLTENGHLQWTAPERDERVWRVVWVVAVSGGLDPTHPALGRGLIDVYYEPFAQANPGQAGKALNFFFQDELNFMSGGMPYWSERVSEAFMTRKGYDLVPYLPALWYNIGPLTPKIRMDYFDVVVALMEDAYFRPIFEWHDSRGITMGCDQESRGSLVEGVKVYGDYFRTVRWFGAPGADDPGAAERRDLFKGKVHSSIAQLYGRSRVWLEGYHSSGWGVTPAQLIAFTNENIAFGYNLLNLHGLYYTTYGGYWEWAPPDFHFRQPYWKHMGAFNAYVSRLGYLMSQGHRASDVAMLYPTSTVQAGLYGEEAGEAIVAIGQKLFDAGMDYDFLDDESMAGASVSEDGRLEIAGGRYRTLILPFTAGIRIETLRKALAFHRAGGLVIAYGCLPEADDLEGRGGAELNAAVIELFGKCANNVILPGDPQWLLRMLEDRLERDVMFSAPDIVVHHRVIDGMQVYFLHSIRGDQATVHASFRQYGCKVERWDAWSGHILPMENSDVWHAGGRTSVKLTFEPREAIVLVLSGGKETLAEAEAEVASSVAADRDSVGSTGTSTSSNAIITLEGTWSFELHPTMDNRWGDFRLPASESYIGAEARTVLYREGTDENAESTDGVDLTGWQQQSYDDNDWTSYTVTFGPKLWQFGPIDPNANTAELESELLSFFEVDDQTCLRTGETTTGAFNSYAARPYSYSSRMGIDRDPHLMYWLTGPHGLKMKVPDAFIDLGNEQGYPNATFMAADGSGGAKTNTAPGSVWYLWTTVFSDEAHVVAKTLSLSAFTYVSFIPEIELPLPCAAWLNGELVAASSGSCSVQLKPGVNRLLLRFRQADLDPETYTHPDCLYPIPKQFRLRGFAAISDGEPAACKLEPLTLKWSGYPGLLPFDLHADRHRHGQHRTGLFRIQAPPGVRGIRFKAAAAGASVWIGGKEANVQMQQPGTNGEAVQALAQFSAHISEAHGSSTIVAIRLNQLPGYYGGAAFTEPVQFDCGIGEIELGDWTPQGLAAYSGAGVYRKSFELTAEQASSSRAKLAFAKAGATVSVRVNGREAGIRVSPPWEVDLTGLLVPGTNTVELEVSNTLANHYSVAIPSLYVYEGQTASGLYGPIRLLLQ